MTVKRASADVFPELVPPDGDCRAGPGFFARMIDDIDLFPAVAFLLGAAGSVVLVFIVG